MSQHIETNFAHAQIVEEYTENEKGERSGPLRLVNFIGTGTAKAPIMAKVEMTAGVDGSMYISVEQEGKHMRYFYVEMRATIESILKKIKEEENA